MVKAELRKERAHRMESNPRVPLEKKRQFCGRTCLGEETPKTHEGKNWSPESSHYVNKERGTRASKSLRSLGSGGSGEVIRKERGAAHYRGSVGKPSCRRLGGGGRSALE